MGDADAMVVSERAGRVAHLRMNRPDRMNVLDEGLADALAAALDDVAADPAVRAVVLTGAGRSFMAGGDLTRFRDDLDAAPRTAARLIERFHAVIRTIRTMPKPVVAGIQGSVAGGGVGLALACDLVVAADDATLLSAYTRLGTSPDGGTTWSLTRLLGPKRALAFMLLNDPLDARAAFDLGLVNRVVPAAQLDEMVMSLASRLAAASSGANAAVKRLVQIAAVSAFDAQLEVEEAAFVTAAATSDFREGITAFFARRPPLFES